jgi:hypothetical protein
MLENISIKNPVFNSAEQVKEFNRAQKVISTTSEAIDFFKKHDNKEPDLDREVGLVRLQDYHEKHGGGFFSFKPATYVEASGQMKSDCNCQPNNLSAEFEKGTYESFGSMGTGPDPDLTFSFSAPRKIL